MKERHIFYAPDIYAAASELPADESAHAVRVLRMKEGDELTITDGNGHFYDATIALASPKHCKINITKTIQDDKLWLGNIHIAVAPTKNMDRMEWFCEKATEIGLDNITLLLSKNSERRVVKTERLEKIIVSAMKQSHKGFKPQLSPMTDFKTFVTQAFEGEKFIAHCYTPEDLGVFDTTHKSTPATEQIHLNDDAFLLNLVSTDKDSLVLIGPEGDFSIDEVKLAIEQGFKPISLGESRLRTETAALVAVHMMNIKKRRHG